MILYQKSLKIQTTNKVIRVHTEKALSCQPLGVSTADTDSLQQTALTEPLGQPFQLAITKQAACV